MNHDLRLCAMAMAGAFPPYQSLQGRIWSPGSHVIYREAQLWVWDSGTCSRDELM